MPVDPALYRRHRFPPEIISHAVWLYFRFNLSHRDVEELLAERGIQVSYEAIRLWCRKFGHAYTDQLRRRRAGPADKWHVDEMQLKIHGRKYWLWRAVDQDGFVLDILVQERRNEQAAIAFLRRVLAAAAGEPRVIVTDKLASYVPTVKRVLPTTEHRRHKRLNNRAENLLSTRRRSWSRSVLCATSSVRVATVCQPTAIARSCRTASVFGRKWSALRLRERRLRLVRRALSLTTAH